VRRLVAIKQPCSSTGSICSDIRVLKPWLADAFTRMAENRFEAADGRKTRFKARVGATLWATHDEWRERHCKRSSTVRDYRSTLSARVSPERRAFDITFRMCA
jgi:hypothetical protein